MLSKENNQNIQGIEKRYTPHPVQFTPFRLLLTVTVNSHLTLKDLLWICFVKNFKKYWKNGLRGKIGKKGVQLFSTPCKTPTKGSHVILLTISGSIFES